MTLREFFAKEFIKRALEERGVVVLEEVNKLFNTNIPVEEVEKEYRVGVLKIGDEEYHLVFKEVDEVLSKLRTTKFKVLENPYETVKQYMLMKYGEVIELDLRLYRRSIYKYSRKYQVKTSREVLDLFLKCLAPEYVDLVNREKYYVRVLLREDTLFRPLYVVEKVELSASQHESTVIPKVVISARSRKGGYLLITTSSIASNESTVNVKTLLSSKAIAFIQL